MVSERLISGVVEGKEAQAVMKIVFGEYSIIDSLKMRVKIYCSFKALLLGFAEKSAD